MSLSAFKNGLTPFNETIMNQMLALQPFSLIYEGAVYDSKTGAGVLENSIADYNYAIRFTTTGTTSIGRIELQLDKDNSGADITIQIRDNNFNPNGSSEGNVLKEILIPAEFINTTASYISIPINLTGLTSGAYYWIIIKKNGDSTNKNDIVSETSIDSSYPCYKRISDTTGAWTEVNSLHFSVYAGIAGNPKHEIYGTNGITTIEYTSGQPSKIYFYLPPTDGSAGGIRNTLTLNYSNGIITGGV